jgi:hypothetical protein
VSKQSEYEQLISGEWFAYDNALDIACCHCGLVHRLSIDFKNRRVRLVEKARSTAALRRHHEFPCKPAVKRRKKSASPFEDA